ncbi:hypothetical protein [Nodosilinea sp. P-1105]|uniref:hypothetical protein n=1 Tax=Nodosilinea sp. P-1105 TaxID=2546229 RepID=UPI00146B191C|nr:hypothetical protein [Nodosilinea sp. P-1105]NMF83402.1 hypothetical protein [Nodosilinea sp. P-1105]
MARKIPLTFNELAVLKSFGDLCEASIPQLAVEARLTPTEMRETLFGLEGKSLVRTAKGGYFAQITPLGTKALTNWEFDEYQGSSTIVPKGSRNRPNPQTAFQPEKCDH